MSGERRGRFRGHGREELEAELNAACAEAFAAQAREERVSRRLLAFAARGEDGNDEVRGLLADLGDAHAELDVLRARVTRLRAELGGAESEPVTADASGAR